MVCTKAYVYTVKILQAMLKCQLVLSVIEIYKNFNFRIYCCTGQLLIALALP